MFMLMTKMQLKHLKFIYKLEGIIPALEPAHALSFVLKFASNRKKTYISNEYVWKETKI